MTLTLTFQGHSRSNLSTPMDSPYYAFLLMFNSNILTWPNMLLYKIQSFEIWVTLTLTFKVTQGQMGWCHWTLHIWFPTHIYSKRMSISHRLVVIATQNVFSYLLSLGPNYEKSKVHRMTPKWHWTLKGQRYLIYFELLPMSPKFHSVLLYDLSFSRWMRFWVSPWLQW